MRFTLITERRRHAPRGRDGGADGAPGRNLLNGETLPPKCAGELAPGDRLRIETPGRRRAADVELQHESQIWHFDAALSRLGPQPGLNAPPGRRSQPGTTFTTNSPRTTNQCLLPSKSGP